MGLLLYLASLFGKLIPVDVGPDQRHRRAKVVRWLWSAAFVAYLAHVVLAFQYFHGWSHVAAYEHVVRESGFGAGLYFNYAFTLIWSADVGYWWCGIDRYARRRAWVSWLLHGFMFFIVFNGAVVFADGETRCTSLLMFAIIAVHAVSRLVPTMPVGEGKRAFALVVGWVVGGVVGILPGLAVAIYRGSFAEPAADDFHTTLLWSGSIAGVLLGGPLGLWADWRRAGQSLANRS